MRQSATKILLSSVHPSTGTDAGKDTVCYFRPPSGTRKKKKKSAMTLVTHHLQLYRIGCVFVLLSFDLPCIPR